MLEFGGPIRPCPGALAGAVICLWSPSDSDLTSKSNLDQSTCPLLSKKCIGKGDSFTLNDIAGSTYKGMRVFPSIARLMENNCSRSGRTQSLHPLTKVFGGGSGDLSSWRGRYTAVSRECKAIGMLHAALVPLLHLQSDGYLSWVW